MKPPPFGYVAPTSLEEALALLGQLGDEGKVLAGGQSLIPAMNLRLLRPGVLVDLGRVPGLAYVVEGDGWLEIGAMTRQRAVEVSDVVRRRCPILVEALGHVGHLQTRRRGTVGGSLAHADPSAELPAVMVALGAQYVVRGPSGSRVVPADAFTLSAYATVLEPGEILTAVRVPWLGPQEGWCFLEFARKHGAFAIVGVAALVESPDGRHCARVRLAAVGGEPRARRLLQAERVLAGRELGPAVLEELRRAVEEEWQPDDDPEAPSEFRRAVAGVLAGRAVQTALTRRSGHPGMAAGA